MNDELIEAMARAMRGNARQALHEHYFNLAQAAYAAIADRVVVKVDLAGVDELVATMKDQIESWEFEDPRETWWKWQHQYAQAATALQSLAAQLAHMDAEIDRLAQFIMHEVPGEPSQSDGAVDTAIRVMRVQAAQLAEARAEIERLREALVAEREENLWSAYATGDVRGDEWTHLYMSDGEWLVRQCGLDPKQGYYKAAEIREAIPIVARAALKGNQQ